MAPTAGALGRPAGSLAVIRGQRSAAPRQLLLHAELPLVHGRSCVVDKPPVPKKRTVELNTGVTDVGRVVPDRLVRCCADARLQAIRSLRPSPPCCDWWEDAEWTRGRRVEESWCIISLLQLPVSLNTCGSPGELYLVLVCVPYTRRGKPAAFPASLIKWWWKNI